MANIDSDEEEEILLMMMLETEERRKRTWVRQPALYRPNLGEFSALWATERGDPAAFQSAYRMHPDTFDEVTALLAPVIRKQDTNYRLAITPAEKVALTLR